MMTSAVEAPTRCPACGAAVAVDPGYSPWCTECGWNADPYPPASPDTRAARRRLRELDAIDAVFRTGRRVSPASAYALAAAVHLVTVLVAGCAVWVVLGSGLAAFVRWAAAAILGLLAVTVAPKPTRTPRLRRDMKLLDRTSAPALWDLLDAVSKATGARPPAAVVVVPDWTSDLWLVGLRRRRVLVIGLAMWTVLAKDERLAMLAHELAQGRGDPRRSLILTGALGSLRSWLRVLGRANGSAMPSMYLAGAPRWAHRATASYRVEAATGVAAFNAVVAAPRYLIGRWAAAIVTRARLAGQERERRADVAAAEAAASQAAVRWLERLYVDEVVRTWLARCAQANREPNWGELATVVAAVPARQLERGRRVGRLRGRRVDPAHAATSLRIDALRSGPQAMGKVFVTDRHLIDIGSELNVAP